MKILFLGDYSGFHLALANQLRKMGHDCVVAGDGSRCMNTARDIDITRRPGIIGSIKYLYDAWSLLPKLKDFDIVQLINPGFFNLRPGKLKYFFDRIIRQNPFVGLSIAGSDSIIVNRYLNANKFKYSEFQVDGKPAPYASTFPGEIDAWLARPLADYTEYVYEGVDCAISALYEYHALAEPFFLENELFYGGIPIDVESIPFKPLSFDGPLRILVGIKSEMEIFKGTDRMLRAARIVADRNPGKVVVDVARDLPFSEYSKKVSDAHVVVDQLYSYSPATNALQAMASGKIAVSGAEPDFYGFIGEDIIHPVINAVPDDEKLIDLFENLVNMPPEKLVKLSSDGRTFVEKHNSAEVVANRFLNAWERAMK